MGTNCSCLRNRNSEKDISIITDDINLIINKTSKLKKDKFLKSLISIQSHIKGFLTRKKLNLQNLQLGKFFPYMEPDLPYQTSLNSKITNEEIKYLFENYESLNDDIPIVCLKTIEYTNGTQYFGEFNQSNNQKHGRGILKFNNGSTYYGQFKNDKAYGKGKLIFKDLEEYEGDWEDNKANGYGIYKSNDVIYEGKWKDDRQEGIGTEKWNNGTSYTGEFKLGQKTGKGKFKYIDGANYTGNFLNNQMHGKGIYIWSDGREYNGDWKYNKIEGEGVFKWPDGRRYIGHYKNDKKDGYGIFEWPNGKKYKGFWKNGKQQGEGESYDPIERKWIKGYWNEGKKDVGPVLISSSSQEGTNITRNLKHGINSAIIQCNNDN